MANNQDKSPILGTYLNRDLGLEAQAFTFTHEAFDLAVHSQGITLQHFQAMPCPIGKIDKFDIRSSSHDDHGSSGLGACSNGFLYRPAGNITCLFLGNNTNWKTEETGTLTGATVRITIPRTYDDNTNSAQVLPYDRLYLLDDAITVDNWQLVQTNLNGVDKLNFPVVSVIFLVDSSGKQYYSSIDYEIVNGQIKWLTQNRPGIDDTTGLGVVYSIRYRYRPYWYISDLIHEVRVAQAEENGQRVVKRMNQQVVAQREYVFESDKNDPESVTPNSPRQNQPPGRGPVFGPR